jgi:hypothetical protein
LVRHGRENAVEKFARIYSFWEKESPKVLYYKKLSSVLSENKNDYFPEGGHV